MFLMFFCTCLILTYDIINPKSTYLYHTKLMKCKNMDPAKTIGV